MKPAGPDQHYDLIIAGGGLVGASLALGLADQPLKIAVVETNPPLISKANGADNRTLALARTSCQILDQLGVWSELKQHATPLQQIHVSDMGRFGIMRFTAAESRLPAFGYAISAEKLTAILQERVINHPKIHWIAPASIKKLTAKQDGYSVEIQTAESSKTYHTHLLVAADGTKSHTRSLLDIAVETHDYHQKAITAQITLSCDHKNIAYERFSPSGPLGLLPGGPKQCALAWVSPPEQADTLMALDETAFCQALQKILGRRVGKILHVGQRNTYPLHSLYAKKQILPHAVLLGNSAHTLHPVAAQGFNLSLRDARALIQTIQQAIEEQKNPGDLTVLQQYLSKRQSEQNKIRFATHSLVYCFSTTFLPITFGRNLTMFALNFLPKIRRLMANYGMGNI